MLLVEGLCQGWALLQGLVWGGGWKEGSRGVEGGQACVTGNVAGGGCL